MNLKFVIDKNYLISNTLRCMKNEDFSSEKDKKDIIEFQNYVWNKSNNFYDFLSGRFFIRPDIDLEKIVNEFKDIPKFLKKIEETELFKKIYTQTEEYLKFCENEWNKNYKKTSDIIKKLTGLTLNKNFTIYITHPSQKNGTNLGDNKITWGHNEDWSNYSVVYLWHEILHSYFNKTDLEHSIIELICDEELRVKLNGGEYPPFVGHERLTNIKSGILLEWNKYKENGGDILKFLNSIKN